MKKIIYAVGVHNDGGLNILKKFIEKCDDKIFFYLDERVKLKKNKSNFIFIKKNPLSRFLHLISLKKNLNSGDHVLFLNGLPPILNLNCEVSVVFQNANIFRFFYKIEFIKWFFSKDFIRNLIFNLGKKKVNNWYVFSPVAESILKKKIDKYLNLKIIDIYADYKYQIYNDNNKLQYDFIYPASGLHHKNHKLLFDVLISLSKEKIFPRVLITLENEYFEKLKIKKIKKLYNLRIDNYFEKDQKKFLNIYKKCKSLLYLSKNETIGLPLLEANKYGLITIAPNLDYSKQFIKPDYIFDINSKSELENIVKKITNNSFIKKKNVNNFIYYSNSINFEDFVKKIL